MEGKKSREVSKRGGEERRRAEEACSSRSINHSVFM